jgi:hypothetical protein
MLALYPGEFRDEYGREMALVFADRLHAAPGPFERLRIVIEAAWGVFTQAPREHAAMAVQDLRYTLRGLRRIPSSQRRSSSRWRSASAQPPPCSS